MKIEIEEFYCSTDENLKEAAMKIYLNDKVGVDLPKLIESRLLVQANSGGGKSWAIRRIIEQAFGKVQIIVLDPEGEFTNLREKHDFVFAGKDGDAPVESRAVERDRISEETGYQRSSRDTYLQRLGARQLVAQEGRGMVKASDTLFSES